MKRLHLLKFSTILPLLLALILIVPAYSLGTAKSADSSKSEGTKVNTIDFRNTMRKLWEDHITWTRLFIVSDAANLPDKAATTARLLKNQTDIGNAIKPFYGEQAGDKLTALLRDHILIAAELVDDAKAGNTTAFNDAKARWYDNANQIAVFLNSANPKFWPLSEMQAMMKAHLDLTLKEASDQLKGNYPASVADYDLVHNEILQMADMLSIGIIHQFPQKFTSNSGQ